jgi:hypothetical protein
MNTRRGSVGHQIAHTLTTGVQQGTLHFVDLSVPPLVTEACRSLNTRQSGIHKSQRRMFRCLKRGRCQGSADTSKRRNVRQNGRRMKEPEEPMFTITATDRHGILPIGAESEGWCQGSVCGCRVFMTGRLISIDRRLLTAQLYKQAGNGVTVNVIEAIGTIVRQKADSRTPGRGSEKTKRRQYGMIGIQDQYFGTEIEMTGITRQRCCGEVVAEMFGTEAYYDGTTYGVWSVTDQEGKKWKFMYDGSIYTQRKVYVSHGRRRKRIFSTEMVSPKLSYG